MDDRDIAGYPWYIEGGSNVSYDDVNKLIKHQDILLKKKSTSYNTTFNKNNIIGFKKSGAKHNDINSRKALYEFQQVEKLDYYKYILKIIYTIVFTIFIFKIIFIQKKYNNPAYLFLTFIFILFILSVSGNDIKYHQMFGFRPFLYLPTEFIDIQNIRGLLKNIISTTINYFEIIIPNNVYSSI